MVLDILKRVCDAVDSRDGRVSVIGLGKSLGEGVRDLEPLNVWRS